ncbi:MAG: DedA family protein [Thermoplasmata archaeon]|jgi:membrane protein DedA with SNARE-associated domain
MSISSVVVNFVINYLKEHGYLGIFILMTLESAMLPLPSEVIIPFSAYLAYLNYLNIYLVIMFSTLGGLAGSLIAYYIGYFGGRELIIKYGKYFFIYEEDLERAERWFNKYGPESVFIARLLPVIRGIISLPAGIGKMNIVKFSIYTFLGTLIWSVILSYTAYYLGSNWNIIVNVISSLDPVIVIIGILILIYIIYKIYKNRKSGN